MPKRSTSAAPNPAFRETYQGTRVCVTGGAGFIGSHLCEALVGLAARVSVIDDLSNGRAENFDAIAAEIRFVEGSILDPDALSEAVGGCQMVFHQAAVASVPRSVEEPERYFQVNAVGTQRVLEEARRSGGRVKRVIYAASSSAYGGRPELPKIETMAAMPLSPYASAKFAGEHLLRAYCHCYGLNGISLRYFNIFGPRQRQDSPYAAVIPKFADALLTGRRPVIFGDGKQTRDFTYVANAVNANLLAGASKSELRGDVVNVACGQSLSLLQLLEAIAAQLGMKAECDFAPARAGEVMHSRASIEAARALIGYEPVVGFEAGLATTLEHYSKLAQAPSDRAARVGKR